MIDHGRSPDKKTYVDGRGMYYYRYYIGTLLAVGSRDEQSSPKLEVKARSKSLTPSTCTRGSSFLPSKQLDSTSGLAETEGHLHYNKSIDSNLMTTKGK